MQKKIYSDIPVSVWSVIITIFLLPLCIDLFVPFLLLVPFLVTIISQKNALRDIISIIKNKNLLCLFVIIDIIIICIGIIPAQDKLYAMLMCLMWIISLSCFFSIFITIKTPKHFYFCILALVISCGVTVYISVLQEAAYNTVPFISNPFWIKIERDILESLPFFQFNLGHNLDPRRFCATFLNANVYAMFLAIVFPFCFYIMATAKNNTLKVLGLINSLLCVYALAITLSRAPYVALIAVVAFLLIGGLVVFLKNKSSKGYRNIILFMLAFVAVIALVIVIAYKIEPNSEFFIRFKASFSVDSSKTIRYNLWRVSSEFFSKQPIFGFGTGMQNQWAMFKDLQSYGIVLTDVSGAIIKGVDQPHAHNLFVQILLEGGLLRFTSFFAVIGMSIKNIFTLAKSTDKNIKLLSVCFFGFFFAVVLCGISDFMFVDPKFIGLYLIVVALCGCAVNIFCKNQE